MQQLYTVALKEEVNKRRKYINSYQTSLDQNGNRNCTKNKLSEDSSETSAYKSSVNYRTPIVSRASIRIGKERRNVGVGNIKIL